VYPLLLCLVPSRIQWLVPNNYLTMNILSISPQHHSANPPKDENASTMIVALGLDVGVGHEEHQEDDDDDVPSR
jgi:hypothetical protein